LDSQQETLAKHVEQPTINNESQAARLKEHPQQETQNKDSKQQALNMDSPAAKPKG
jgi:hypothetical protein